MMENEENNGLDFAKFPAEVQNQVVDKSMTIFEHLMRKYPSDCIDFISKFTAKDEFVKSEYNALKTFGTAFGSNPREYGLGYIKGNYPKTGLNN